MVKLPIPKAAYPFSRASLKQITARGNIKDITSIAAKTLTNVGITVPSSKKRPQP
jgi:hypothetical protein